MTMVTQKLITEAPDTSSIRYKLSDNSIDLLVNIMLNIATKEDNNENNEHSNAAA